MAQQILKSSQSSVQQLDLLIKQMETTLGKAHTTSPFTQLYSQYGFSTNTHKETVGAEETKDPVEQVKDTTQKEEKKAEKKQKPVKESAKQPP